MTEAMKHIFTTNMLTLPQMCRIICDIALFAKK